MAVTTEKSAQLNNIDAQPPVMNPAYEEGGRLRTLVFEFTQGAAAGDATSTMDLAKLPPGKLRIFGHLSFMEWSAFGAARVTDVGYLAHTDSDGVAVAADLSALDLNIDVSSAGSAVLGSDVTAALGKMLELNSNDGITIQANVAGGTIPVGATLTGTVVYALD